MIVCKNIDEFRKYVKPKKIKYLDILENTEFILRLKNGKSVSYKAPNEESRIKVKDLIKRRYKEFKGRIVFEWDLDTGELIGIHDKTTVYH